MNGSHTTDQVVITGVDKSCIFEHLFEGALIRVHADGIHQILIRRRITYQGFTFQEARKQLADNCGEFLYNTLLA